MTRTLLIINPTAGHGKARTVCKELVEEVKGSEVVNVVLTGARGDAERAAKSAADGRFKRVYVAGGDGTINEVVNGLAGSDVELGIVALGTANVLARELNLPVNDVRASVAALREATPRRIDLVRAGSRYCAAMAGFGFDAAVVHRVAPRIKDVIGAGAYVLATAEELIRQHPANFRLEIDGKVVTSEAFVVVVANSASYAYGIKIAPHALLDDGELDVIVFEKARPPKLALMYQALRVLFRNHLADPNVRYFKGKRIMIDAEPSVLMQLDGDVTGSSPAAVEVVPKALNAIVASTRSGD